MRIIKQSALKDFWQQHADAEKSLKAWYAEAKAQIGKNHQISKATIGLQAF